MQHYSNEQTSGLFIPLVPELRQRIRKAAAQNNITEQEYIKDILNQVVPSETAHADESPGKLNKIAVEDLLRFREHLRQAHPGQKFPDSVELLHQAREDRLRELEQR